MALELQVNQRPNPSKSIDARNKLVTIGVADDTILFEGSVTNVGKLFGRIANTGGQAFDAFKVLAKCTDDADDNWVDVSAVAGIVTASAGISTLAALAVGWFLINCQGIYKIRITASASVGATTAYFFMSGW